MKFMHDNDDIELDSAIFSIVLSCCSYDNGINIMNNKLNTDKCNHLLNDYYNISNHII